MRGSWTFRLGVVTVALTGVMAYGVVAAGAQGFGGGMPPEIAAKIKLWQKWRDSHKNVSNLQTMLYQVNEMDKSPDTKLDKKQAGKLLTIYKSWETKPQLNEDQALQAQKQIGNVLNVKQIQKMTTIQPPWARPGGMGGGGARPGGGGGARPGGAGGGAFKFPDPPKGSYNPLNADTLPFEQMRAQAKHNMQEFESQLQQRARG
jgi:hypothetical protein